MLVDQASAYISLGLTVSVELTPHIYSTCICTEPWPPLPPPHPSTDARDSRVSSVSVILISQHKVTSFSFSTFHNLLWIEASKVKYPKIFSSLSSHSECHDLLKHVLPGQGGGRGGGEQSGLEWLALTNQDSWWSWNF